MWVRLPPPTRMPPCEFKLLATCARATQRAAAAMYAGASNGEATTIVDDATPSPTVGATGCEEWEEDATDGGCLFGDGAIADAAMVAATAACDDGDGGGGGGGD